MTESHIDWKRISELKQTVDQAVKGEILSHWTNMDKAEMMPDIIRRFLPEGIDFRLLRYPSEEEIPAEHRLALKIMSPEGENPLHVIGTMDAKNDPEYRLLYEKFGWRTAIYMLVNIFHEPIPDPEVGNVRRLGVQVPGVIFSPHPDAITEDNLIDLVTIVDLGLTAMLLRIGVTFFASRSMHLWQSIPGALLLVSPDNIYEANDEARRWFHLDISPGQPVSISTILPDCLCRWIADTIGSDGIYSSEQGNATFWLNDTLRTNASLRPYRPWEKIKISRMMATGYRGIENDQINTRLHLLLLRDVTREWEADILEQEVRLARRMQIGLQPEVMPQTPVFDIVATCQPAHNIGGDLYDAVTLEDGCIAMVIGDATGHGVDSALLAAVVSGAFRSSVAIDPDPNAVLRSIDGVLRRTQQHGFVTLIYMLLEADGSAMQYGLAGHYPPIIFHHHDPLPESTTPESLPLGVSLPSHYHFETVSLSAGDIIAAFSDGFLECRNAVGETFQQVIPGIIRKYADGDADGMLRTLLKEINEFSHNPVQQDDFTAIIIRIKNPVCDPSWKKSAQRLSCEGAGLSSATRKERSDESAS
ncbi:serine/threonine-protein phosphatase [bacterium]|nr:serine/threonine-protein phosphatase [candidate division CSSED10-310 bacterium]